ncbi:VOC family protein [Streptomyces sp. DH12]|uniref:VOC family protein n=1 Tax=Streptomyces sp. DH12 TaxID=2857010 RepID=UPI001E4F1231|nr:VOC family protein [Streptomyces sp. DH12]
MSVAKVGSVVLDCPDPHALAGFYAGVVGGTPEGEGDWVDLAAPGGPTLAFQRAEGHDPPRWPAADRSQQFHLDFDAGGTWEEVDAAEAKVLALGARVLDREDYEKKDFRVYADPAGHPFCLCRIEQP